MIYNIQTNLRDTAISILHAMMEGNAVEIVGFVGH